MTLLNLPAPINAAVQQGYLRRVWESCLTAKLGFRDAAERIQFPGQIGETMTFSKPGLLGPVLTAVGPRDNNDITDGMIDDHLPLEQYSIGVQQYGKSMKLQLASNAMGIADQYLLNAEKLAENASRSLATLAGRALYDGYQGGNTWVTVTNSGGTTVHVDDVRGFFESVDINNSGQVLPTSVSNPMGVIINGSSTVYHCTGVVADGVRPSGLSQTFKNLSFAGSGSNTSKLKTTLNQGYSGTLTFDGNVPNTDAAIGNSVLASTAPTIFRAGAKADSTKLVPGDLLTAQMILDAKNQMESNGLDITGANPFYCFISPKQAGQLYQDVEFQRFFETRADSEVFRRGVIANLMGVNLVVTNLIPVDTDTISGASIHRAIIVGPGALMEADFTSAAYNSPDGLQGDNAVSLVEVVDNVAHVTRPPLNQFGDVVTQTWTTIIGFQTPTDMTANSLVIPTASSAARKRAAILESIG